MSIYISIKLWTVVCGGLLLFKKVSLLQFLQFALVEGAGGLLPVGLLTGTHIQVTHAHTRALFSTKHSGSVQFIYALKWFPLREVVDDANRTVLHPLRRRWTNDKADWSVGAVALCSNVLPLSSFLLVVTNRTVSSDGAEDSVSLYVCPSGSNEAYRRL